MMLYTKESVRRLGNQQSRLGYISTQESISFGQTNDEKPVEGNLSKTYFFQPNHRSNWKALASKKNQAKLKKENKPNHFNESNKKIRESASFAFLHTFFVTARSCVVTGVNILFYFRLLKNFIHIISHKLGVTKPKHISQIKVILITLEHTNVRCFITDIHL